MSAPTSVSGAASVHRISAVLGTDPVQINAIYFEPGARYRPHRHTYDQVLCYVYGTGLVALDGGEDVVVPAGQFVLLPANVVQMHGCTDEGPALQLSIMREVETDFDVPYPASWEKWRSLATLG